MTALIPNRIEMLIGGSWVDVAQGSRTRGDEKIVIRDGSSSESSFLAAGTCNFTLNNRDSVFSTSNVTGPYYGKLGRNIQVRHGFYGTKYLKLLGQTDTVGNYDGTAATVPDRAALDIVGDIDIRFDFDPMDWHSGPGRILISKYNTLGDQRSWALYTTAEGGAQFVWSIDGTVGNRLFAALGTLPNIAGRYALRFTLDVDNGAGGYTATWYSSDTIGGSWTTIATTTTTSGVTSIFSSSAILKVGDLAFGSLVGMLPLAGKVYGAEVRSSIGGTVVAKLDPSARSRGDLTWADGFGSTWTCAGLAVIDDMDYRFWGAVNKLPQRWDTTGRDVWVPLTATDVLGQIAGGTKTLQSPFYRLINTQYAGPVAPTATSTYYTGWWPMESGSDISGTISAVKGQTGTFSNATFGAWSAAPGTGGALIFSDDTGNASGAPKTITTYSNGYIGFTCMFMFQVTSIPATPQIIMRWRLQAGQVATATLTIGPAGYSFNGYDRYGLLLYNTAVAFGAAPTSPTLFRASIGSLNPANVHVDLGWLIVGTSTFYGTSDIWSYTMGRCVSWDSPGWTGKSGMKLGQVVIQQGDTVAWATTSLTNAASAYAGETAIARFGRLLGESGYAWQIRGAYDTSQIPTMGPQTANTLFALLRECVDVTGGVMYAAKEFYGVVLRTIRGIAGRNQYSPTVDYALNYFSGSLEPDKSNITVRNSITASRPGGGERYAVKTSGSLNINDSDTDPDGAGIWEAPITRNVNTDVQLQTQANWELALGTDDSDRYSLISFQLDRPEFSTAAGAALAAQLRTLHIGDVFTMTNLPAWMGSIDPSVMIRGRTEIIDNFTHRLDWNAAPATPYQWGSYDYSEGYRWGSTSTTMAASMTSSATYGKFALGTAQTRWSQKAVPYDVLISGQRNTVLEVGAKGSLGTADFGGFESGTTTGWAATGGALTNSTAQAKHGDHSGLITVSGSPATVTLRRSSSTFYVPVVAASSYTLTFWIRSSITLTSTLTGVIDWYAGAAFLSTSTSTAISAVANTWTQLTFTVTAPATATFAQYGANVSGSPANGTLFYFDAVEVAGPDVSFQPVIMTRGVDGNVKALTSGDKVQVYDSIRWGRN